MISEGQLVAETWEQLAPDLHDEWCFIEEFGRRIGAGHDAILKWRVRGVPHKFRMALVEAATRQRFPLAMWLLDSPPLSSRRRSAA